METRNIFITGVTGAVGHYLIEELAQDQRNHIYGLLRDPSKFKIDVTQYSNVTLITGNLEDIQVQAEILQKTDILIHAATNWCGHVDANIIPVRQMLSLLDPERIRKIILFSTASILGRGNKLLPEARTQGTAYVQSKYECYLDAQTSPLRDKIIHVFPTVIISGDEHHPYTHIGEGLSRLRHQIRWLKYFYIELGFHFIHTQDIARIVSYMLDHEMPGHDYVLGNDYVSYKEFIREVAAYFQRRPLFQVKIPHWLIRLIIKIFRFQVEPWAFFCYEYKYFRYNTVNCRTFGLPVDKMSVRGMLAELGEKA